MATLLVLAAFVWSGAAGCRRQPPPPSITGIGMMLAMRNNALEVMGVLPGTPAAKAGLRQGLIIQEVNGTNVAGMSLRDCVAMTRGPVGSRVRLTVVDITNNSTNLIEFTREKILLPESRGPIKQLPGGP